MRSGGGLLKGRVLVGVTAALAASLLAASLAPAAFADHDGKRGTRHALFIGNNWDGTVTVIRPGGNFGKLGRINVIPDRDERMAEILMNPVRLGYFLGIRALVGEGNDQFADDMYTSRNGKRLVISRPSFKDVVGLNIRTGQIAWRFPVAGQRSDHMAVSPDGRHVAVSASTGNVVHILNMRTGREVGRFPSGDSPHENVYSKGGELIYHASIGLVYTPADRPVVDTTKGERYFQIVDADTNRVIRRLNMGRKLEQAGYPNMSSAVRPMTFSRNERFVYFQVSFFHGFVEYDLKRNRVRRVKRLPIAEHARNTPREQYLLDSAHHGIAMNPQGSRLCVAGTMSDYATIVSRRSFARGPLITGGKKPYWSTPSASGRHCFVSWSGSDRISAISYRTRREVKRIPVGDHPQRMRLGNVHMPSLRAGR